MITKALGASKEKIRQNKLEDEVNSFEFGRGEMMIQNRPALMSTQKYMQKVVEDVGEDDDFKSGAWVSATNYVTATGGTVTGCLEDIENNLKKGKLDQVVLIVMSCSPNALGDLIVTMKDLSGTISGSIHYKVIGEGG
ncbi:hypothetical protein Tco_0595581 [Tanacetum coccineum]